MSLLRFPSVATTRYLAESTVLISSLVVVLPFVPVRPITLTLGSCTCSRCQAASSLRVARVSSTGIILGSPLEAASDEASTTAYDAPFERVSIA